MNVLLIAPEPSLPAVHDEIRAVSLALRPVILNGIVTRHDVLEALNKHKWDIIWFMTHGSEYGIELSDGYVTVSDLTAVVRASNAWLVVLNTCSSRLVGLELHYELQVSVITTVAAVDDLTAYQTGALLAHALAQHADPVQAFEKSKPGQNANYLLFHAKTQNEVEETRTILMLNQWGHKLSVKIDALEQRMDWEINAIRKEVNDLSNNIAVVVQFPPRHRIIFAMAFGLLFLPVPLFYSQVREMFVIGWQAALLFAFISYALSAMLWLYVWWGGRNI